MEGERPTRAELERERYEEWLVDTYEDRYLDYCDEHRLDPDDTRSVLAFEEAWEEEREQ
jgi:hypothetical protein